MRGPVIFALCLLIAACSAEPAEEPSDTGTEVPAAGTANGSPAGAYEVAAADGTSSIVTLNADGTYSQVTPEGTYGAEGTYAIVDGKTCFKQRQVGAEPLCYTETAPSEDGSYTATPEGGEPLTVTPVPAGGAIN